MDSRSQELTRLVYMGKDVRGKGGTKRGDPRTVERKNSFGVYGERVT